MSRQRDNARSSPRETKKSAFRRGVRSWRSISYDTLRHMRTESLSNVCPAALVLAGQMFYVDIKRSAQGSLLKVYRHHNMKRATLRPVQNMILESH
ncbi:hypothetical protein CCUS01_08544 [Colletotrichum cuscutae]|uniref:Uncharacterized protein n=1 Tax=Colletotrichum cuscutae TaxID=1209917 RepID=A0AAI9XW74_9PEZI|nr:hypothetical protein CCUS01_08544 [Colletotrichum cuscutae]